MTDDVLPASEAGPRSVEGSVAPGFEPLGDAFARVLDASHDCGGALHVRLDGKVIADMWGGNASADQPWRHDTPSVIFSCTKGLVSILAGELVREAGSTWTRRSARTGRNLTFTTRAPCRCGGCSPIARACQPFETIFSSRMF